MKAGLITRRLCDRPNCNLEIQFLCNPVRGSARELSLGCVNRASRFPTIFSNFFEGLKSASFQIRFLPVDVVRADVHVAREGDAARPRLGHVQRVPVLTDAAAVRLLLPAGVAPAARTPVEK